MIAKYRYRSIHQKSPWYQADTDDIKAMFRNQKFRENLVWLVVELADKNIWLWSSATQRWYQPKAVKFPWWAK